MIAYKNKYKNLPFKENKIINTSNISQKDFSQLAVYGYFNLMLAD